MAARHVGWTWTLWVGLVTAWLAAQGCEDDANPAGPVAYENDGDRDGDDGNDGSDSADGGPSDPMVEVDAGADAGGGDAQAVEDGGGYTDAYVPPGPVAVLGRPSRSAAIAVAEDDTLVVMVNPEDDSVSTFDVVEGERRALIETGDEPRAVVLHPNGSTAFVANQADATVVRIDDIHAGTAHVTATVSVGSEPTGIALSPSGARLYVAEWAEGRVSVIDTVSMTVSNVVDTPDHPYTLAVTNDGDTDDTDELLVVPEFYGEPMGPSESAQTEAVNDGRRGRVRLYRTSDLEETDPILFAPIASGFAGSVSETDVPTSPNQLSAVAIQAGKVYVTSISASPAPPLRFNSNVFPVVHVGELGSRTEDRSPAGSASYARLVRDRSQPDATKVLSRGLDRHRLHRQLQHRLRHIARWGRDATRGLRPRGDQPGLGAELTDRSRRRARGCDLGLPQSDRPHHGPQRAARLRQLLGEP